MEAHLAADERLHVLPAGAAEDPDVLLVIAAEPGEGMFSAPKHGCPEGPAEAPRLVLVADEPTAEQLVRAAGLGPAAFLPRDRTTLADITETLCAVARGAASLPWPLPGSPPEQIHTRRRDDQSGGANDESSFFTARELEVLRQLAEGSSTAEIAAALHYSERTVKYVIHEVIVRHGLRNRVHAVAFALRQGLL
ncbi:helix-turn-helix transcriptional regulator [Streptomyces shenzhenensis]|uniref:helix-turn-helix transcriptional regulator n=1 Tax=Streptomyces shenzhenensis TaxID=943815 RepID=UPI001F322138|nr:response regulator transcription factor [Streptomyces shenzhenensis]